jgi:hypothetical protein
MSLGGQHIRIASLGRKQQFLPRCIWHMKLWRSKAGYLTKQKFPVGIRLELSFDSAPPADALKLRLRPIGTRAGDPDSHGRLNRPAPVARRRLHLMAASETCCGSLASGFRRRNRGGEDRRSRGRWTLSRRPDARDEGQSKRAGSELQ